MTGESRSQPNISANDTNSSTHAKDTVFMHDALPTAQTPTVCHNI